MITPPLWLCLAIDFSEPVKLSVSLRVFRSEPPFTVRQQSEELAFPHLLTFSRQDGSVV